MGIMVSLQASIQSKLRPATWLPGIRNVHSEECEWTIVGLSSADALKSIYDAAKALEPDDFIGRSIDKASGKIVVDTLTKAKWLDQIRMTVTPIDSKSCKASVICSSTGFLPLIIPFAPIFNVVLCFVPFGDGGKCEESMETLRKMTVEIATADGVHIDSKTIRQSLTNPRKE
mmetsp:Transcript_569/g.858  ORF Transcript_569/g.858 Transcript_569/m.858 type:complete len:173 (+) Transcript_569:178-696(+)